MSYYKQKQKLVPKTKGTSSEWPSVSDKPYVSQIQKDRLREEYIQAKKRLEEISNRKEKTIQNAKERLKAEKAFKVIRKKFESSPEYEKYVADVKKEEKAISNEKTKMEQMFFNDEGKMSPEEKAAALYNNPYVPNNNRPDMAKLYQNPWDRQPIHRPFTSPEDPGYVKEGEIVFGDKWGGTYSNPKKSKNGKSHQQSATSTGGEQQTRGGEQLIRINNANIPLHLNSSVDNNVLPSSIAMSKEHAEAFANKEPSYTNTDGTVTKGATSGVNVKNEGLYDAMSDAGKKISLLSTGIELAGIGLNTSALEHDKKMQASSPINHESYSPVRMYAPDIYNPAVAEINKSFGRGLNFARESGSPAAIAGMIANSGDAQVKAAVAQGNANADAANKTSAINTGNMLKVASDNTKIDMFNKAQKDKFLSDKFKVINADRNSIFQGFKNIGIIGANRLQNEAINKIKSKMYKDAENNDMIYNLIK